MPYIKPEDRKLLLPYIDVLNTQIKEHPDHEDNCFIVMGYAFYHLCREFIGKELKYSKINDVIGAVECCKLEMHRKTNTKYLGEFIVDFAIDKIIFPKKIDLAITNLVNAANSMPDFDKNRAGLLNYTLTMVAIYLIKSMNLEVKEVGWVMNFVKRHIYKLIAIPYEDLKIKENGDCYDK